MRQASRLINLCALFQVLCRSFCSRCFRKVTTRSSSLSTTKSPPTPVRHCMPQTLPVVADSACSHCVVGILFTFRSSGTPGTAAFVVSEGGLVPVILVVDAAVPAGEPH